MAEWVECTLGDLITLQRGHDLSKGQMQEGLYPVVGSNGIIGFHNEYTTDSPSITVGRSGNVGKPFIYYGKTWSHNTTLYIKDYKGNDPVFVFYFLKTMDLANYSGGSAVPTLNRNHVHTLPINIPKNTDEQRKIGICLKQFDDKIEENKRINNNLEEQAMTLFKSWFIDYEPFDKQVLTTWKYGVLGNFVEIKRGGSPRPIQNFLSNRGLHWLKISDATCISSPFVNEIKEYIIEEGLKKTVFLKAGSLVLSNSATPGLPKILDIDTCIHDGWLYFPSSKFSNEYLYLYFKYIRNNLVALGNGSVFTNLKTDILKNYPTNLPTDDVLNKFDKIVKPIFSMILSKTRESKRLIEIRDTLLPKLMSGELDVSNIDF